MTIRSLLFLFFALSTSAHSACADVVDGLDFSIAGQGSTHDDEGDDFETSPIAGGNAPNDWLLTFGSLGTDGTTNEFITTGGVMRVQDWGGIGTVTGSSWTATTNGTLDIVGTGLTIGTDVFNIVGTEGITWFYSIDGGSVFEVFLGETELGGPVSAGTDVGNTFSGIVLNAGDSVSYGFSVNVNGANDGVEISSMELDFTAVPEPSGLAVLSVFGLAMLGRRSKK